MNELKDYIFQEFKNSNPEMQSLTITDEAFKAVLSDLLISIEQQVLKSIQDLLKTDRCITLQSELAISLKDSKVMNQGELKRKIDRVMMSFPKIVKGNLEVVL